MTPDQDHEALRAPAPYVETPEAAKARKRRSVAIALGLVAFIILIFVVTVVRLGGNVAARSI